jgi:poly-gamma-glutamate capsule biosynthesis protein CapA/YwtB (metallophosphatase superfamily)
MRMRNFRVRRALREEARWLADTLDRESRRFGVRVELRDDPRLELRLAPAAGP